MWTWTFSFVYLWCFCSMATLPSNPSSFWSGQILAWTEASSSSCRQINEMNPNTGQPMDQRRRGRVFNFQTCAIKRSSLPRKATANKAYFKYQVLNNYILQIITADEYRENTCDRASPLELFEANFERSFRHLGLVDLLLQDCSVIIILIFSLLISAELP